MQKGSKTFSRAASIGLLSAILRLHRPAWSFSLSGAFDSNTFILGGHHRQYKNRQFSPAPLLLTYSTDIATNGSSPADNMSTSGSTAADQSKSADQSSLTSPISDELSKLMLEVISSACDGVNAKTALSGEIRNDACRVLRQFIIQQSISKINTTTSIGENTNAELIDNKCDDFFLQNRGMISECTITSTEDHGTIDANHVYSTMSSYALIAAKRMCQIADAKNNEQEKRSRKNNKRTWEALQNAAGTLQNIPVKGKIATKIATNAIEVPVESNALAVCMVFGALSLLQRQQSQHNSEDNGSAKAAASALSSTISRNVPLRQAGQPLSSLVLRSCVDRAFCDKQELFCFDLNILNHLAKSFQLTDKFIEPRVIAHIVRKAVPTLQTNDEREDLVKQTTAGAFALSCQLRPWSILSPIELIDAATTFDFYHSAEEICRSAHKAANYAEAATLRSSEGNDQDDKKDGDSLPFSALEQQKNARCAVEKLIDTAMEGRMYRRADALATSLYSMGGQSRYVKARYFHACDTIAKVVSKRQFPIVDRQIERVDKAVAKVEHSKGTEEKTAFLDPTIAIDPSPSSIALPSSPELEIRKFAIEKFEEAGEISAAQRLASLHGMEYVYDEETILLAAKLRREKFLQYKDLLPGEVPPLITQSHELISAFDRLVQDEKVSSSSPSSVANKHQEKQIGFDAEWDEETQGAALLQLASSETILLIDIPALSSTEDGVNALRETVGKILDGPEWTVIGFACRQDVSRLRASPCVQVHQQEKGQQQQQQHWIAGASSVVDVQPLVGNAEPTLRKTGLSRACEHYLGKPLDKSEQCSLWSGRPLSDRQRTYAALDAWVCLDIYRKVLRLEANGSEI
uniref:3'-5' exonuclease domain-containing protein n=1 Tax=Pseudo-nitzschia australis TaxID=44445 RepID=A0A7S4AGM9_9STRA|mmetsp:Transcript_522/g.1252  ORF Transcript_522/g.1252 Transcript_522/m.1252 type:complete len:861 (-) Transcript_522:75-2657(-)